MSVQHHQLLVRLETAIRPRGSDRELVSGLIEDLLDDIKMHKLGPVESYRVQKRNPVLSGFSWLVPIETSHLALHAWTHPARSDLHSDRAQALIQFDLYTCGRLSMQQIRHILALFTLWQPVRASIALINRKHSMRVENLIEYHGKEPWIEFVQNYAR